LEQGELHAVVVRFCRQLDEIRPESFPQ